MQGIPPGILLLRRYLSETEKSRCAPNQDLAEDLIESQSMSSKIMYPYVQKSAGSPSSPPRSHMLAIYICCPRARAHCVLPSLEGPFRTNDLGRSGLGSLN